MDAQEEEFDAQEVSMLSLSALESILSKDPDNPTLRAVFHAQMNIFAQLKECQDMINKARSNRHQSEKQKDWLSRLAKIDERVEWLESKLNSSTYLHLSVKESVDTKNQSLKILKEIEDSGDVQMNLRALRTHCAANQIWALSILNRPPRKDQDSHEKPKG